MGKPLTEEQREARKAWARKRWAGLTDEQRAERRARDRELHLQRQANRSPEERAELKARDRERYARKAAAVRALTSAPPRAASQGIGSRRGSAPNPERLARWRAGRKALLASNGGAAAVLARSANADSAYLAWLSEVPVG